MFSYNIGVNTLIIQSEDTVPSLLLPAAIIAEKTFYLDSFYEFMRVRYPHPDDKGFEKDLVPFYLRRITETVNLAGTEVAVPHYLSAFPIITPLMVVPLYWIAYMLNVPLSWDTLAVLGHIGGALIMAGSGVAFYKLLETFFTTKKDAKLLTIVYLFGTINYALLSQALWQHGTVQLFLILAFYYLLKSTRQTSIWQHTFLFGLYCGLAFLSRPTAAIAFPFFMFYAVFKLWPNLKQIFKYGSEFALGFLPNALFFLWYNNKYYLSILNQGYADQAGSGWLGRFPEGFLGLWLSPSKGILVYSPIFIFALVGVYLILKKKDYRGDILYFFSFAIVILHTLVLGKWKHWYGGWSYGYRMASDILPFLVLLIVPFLKSSIYKRFHKIFMLLLILSIAIQLHGIIFYDGIWHAAYDGGFQNTSWLWSIQDSEFAFNIRRIMVKFGMLERACPTCN